VLGIAVVLVAARALPAWAGDAPKESLEEAYFLAKCAASDWRDAQSYRRLSEATEDESRKALYLVEFWLASVTAKRPVILERGPEHATPNSMVKFSEISARIEELKEEGFPAVATALRSERTERAFSASFVPTQIEAVPEAPDLMALLLNDRSQSARKLGAMGLGNCTPSAAARRMIPFLAVHVLLDPDFSTKRYSARAIGNLAGVDFPLEDGSPSAQTVAAAEAWIREHYDVSILPGKAAGAAPAEEDGPARQSLAEAYYLARCAAAGWQDAESFQKLMDVVQTDSMRAQCLLNRMFGCLARAKEEPPVIGDAEEELRGRLTQEAEETRAALAALHDEAMLAWATAVRSEIEWEREMAAEGLGDYADNPDGVNLLIMLLNDSSQIVRLTSAYSLGNCGANPAAQQALPFLAVHVLCDPAPFTSRASGWAMSAITGEEETAAVGFFDTGPWARDWIEQHYDLSIFEPAGEASRERPQE